MGDAEKGIREYIKRAILSMKSIPEHKRKLVKKTQRKLARFDLHFPEELVASVVEEMCPMLYVDQRNLRAEIRSIFLNRNVETSSNDLWWLWRDYFNDSEPSDDWVDAVYKEMQCEECTKKLVKDTLAEIKIKGPYFQRSLLDKIYADAIFEIEGHFTLNSMLKILEERGLGYIERPRLAMKALDRMKSEGYYNQGRYYVVRWSRIIYFPPNSHLWPDECGFYLREIPMKKEKKSKNNCSQ